MRGDAAAFAALYGDHQQVLYRYCRSILRHDQDAQDAVQSAMERAFAALQGQRRDHDLRPWLFRIARNEAITILRARRETVVFDDAAVPGRGTEDIVATREDLRALSSDLANLSERQRDALILRELGGLGHQDIARRIGSSPGAVKQAIWEARGALRTCREGREMPCLEVQRTLADGDARHLRDRRLRAHLRTCPGCRRFQADHDRRPRLLFPLSPATGAGLLKHLLSGPASGLSLAGAVPAIGAKILISVSVAAIVAGGAGVAMRHREAPAPPPAAVIDLEGWRDAAPARRDTISGSTTSRPSGPMTGPGGTAVGRTAPRERWRPASEPARRPAAPADGDPGSTADDVHAGSTDRPAGEAEPHDAARSRSHPPDPAAEPQPRPSPPADADRPADARPAPQTGGGAPDTARGRERRGGPPSGSAPGSAGHPRPPAPAGKPAEAPAHAPAAPDVRAPRPDDPPQAQPVPDGPPPGGDQPRDAAPPAPPEAGGTGRPDGRRAPGRPPL